MGPNKVTLTPNGKNATFTLPFYNYPMVNQPLTFQLSVTDGATTNTDTVVITPKSDTVTIGTAKWKAGDFRVTGTATTVGSTVTLRGPVRPDGTWSSSDPERSRRRQHQLSAASSTSVSVTVPLQRRARERSLRTPTSEAPRDRSWSP